MKIRKRNLVKAVSFALAVIVALGAWGIVSGVRLRRANQSIRQSNERALTQLGTYLDDITLNLQKSTYVSGSTLLAEITMDLWRSSVSAKESLAELTGSDTEVSGIYKFLSQVGEYTLSLNEKIASGNGLSKEETDNINKLLQYSRNLSNTVNYLIEQEEAGALDFEEIQVSLLNTQTQNIITGAEPSDEEQALSDYPTLIYDGPFSDHITDKKSYMLEGKSLVSEEDALLKAAEFTGEKTDNLKLLSYTDGNLPTYTFYSDIYTVSVTKNGGYVNYMLTSDFAGETVITQEEAIAKATEYLKSKGYASIKESYYSTSDGICTVNFAYYSGGITYYTDLIKVSVALDDGRIVAFDCTGYLMNHRERSVPENVRYSPEEGKKLVRNTLTVKSYKQAFIPTEWETEAYVYEYHCVDKNGQEVLLYMDPVTGDEKDVLLLLYADGGMLTK